MEFSNQEENAIKLTIICTSSISALCCFTILLIFLLFKRLRTFFMKLVMCINFFDLINSIALIIPVSTNQLCIIQAVATQFCQIASSFFTACIALALHRAVVKKKIDLQQYFSRMVFFSLGFSLLLSSLPFITWSYGPAEGWCWIMAKGDNFWIGTVWRALCFYAPIFFVIGFNLKAYVQVMKIMRKVLSSYETEGTITQNSIRKMLLYPMVLVVCYIPLFVKRIFEYLDIQSPIFVFTIIGAMSVGLVGMLNAIIYGNTEQVRKTVAKRCCKKNFIIEKTDKFETCIRGTMALRTSSEVSDV